MTSRSIRALATTGILVAAGACSTSDRTPQLSTDATALRVRVIADTILAHLFDQVPELNTYYGIPGGRHDRLSDNSLPALARDNALADSSLADLRALNGDTLLGRPEWTLYGSARELLESDRATRVCRRELWSVDQMGGWQIGVAYLATIQPVGTDSLRAQALVRFGTLPAYIETEIVNLREGIRLGYTAPKGAVRLVIEQVNKLLAAPPTESEFYSPAARDSAPAFDAAFLALVTDQINPALTRYRDFLRDSYLAAAREVFAVSAIPNGVACYRAMARAYSTLDVPPDSVHRLGLQQMALIEQEMQVIAERSFGTSDVPGLLRALKSDPKYMFRTRQEIIAYSQAAVDRAKKAMPSWFGILPRADVVIEPYPAFREASASGSYEGAAEDGSRPGVFRISTYKPNTRSRSGPQAVAFHETIPGHHLQGTIALEHAGAIHPLLRYVGNSGYSEGWALYSERLADEMGLYSSDLDRIGMLSEQAYRAARLVIDPALHTMGWTRQQAIAYLASHTTAPQDEAVSEIDRYIIWPGQATSYMLGMLEIKRIRASAESALGPKFDIRAFHDLVLEDGAVPIPMLGAKVGRWVAQGGPAPPSPNSSN